MKKYLVNALLAIGLIAVVSCEEYLDEKPEKSILVPSTQEDVRYLLDNYNTLNQDPLLSFIMADDWVTNTANWQGINPWMQNAYLWQTDVFNPEERSIDYNSLQRKIFYANICLDILDGFESDAETGILKGEALFVRSNALFYLAQLFLPHPDGPEADQIKIPVHFSPDVNSPAEWISVEALLSRVKSDLQEASALVDDKSAYRNRPDKAVVQAMLSRILLYSGDFQGAYDAAMEALNTHYELIDYSAYDASKSYPFDLFNKESMYYGYLSNYQVTDGPASFVDPGLYADYSDNDYRKELFFKPSTTGGMFLFRGSYTGGFSLFTGITYSEVLLNAAESAVRLGKGQEGQVLLEQLATMRYKDLTIWKENLEPDPLETVMRERRRELVFRVTRWGDMKRLVTAGELALPLERIIGNESHRLDSQSQLTLKLPEYEITLENQ